MTTQTHVETWIGFHVNGRGEICANVWDHNPGQLAHVYRVSIPIPEIVREHYAARLDCLVLDKFSKPKGDCREPHPSTD